MWRTATRIALASALVGALPSCEAEEQPAVSEKSTAAAGQQLRSGSFRLHAHPVEVGHAGVRRVDVYDHEATPPTHLAYRERIATDGSGEYSLVPLDALTTVVPGWHLLQRNREGFLFRYRDFAVRDEALFRKNYVLTDLDTRVQVAGRQCAGYRAERRVGDSKRFELAVDLQTNLILKAEEYDAAGHLISVMEYESFDAEPDLAGAVWFQGVHQEKELDRTRSFEEQLGFDPPAPRLLPQGFELREAFTVVDAEGTTWLKLTFTDGVEPLFFLAALDGESGGQERGEQQGAVRLPQPGGQDEVVLFRMGAVRAAQGDIGNRRFIAVGRVSDDDLLDLIESSLP